jgi:hypothetical protein
VLQLRQDGAQVSGQVLWITGGVSTFTGTLSTDGLSFVATYRVTTTTSCCPADEGQVTLVQVLARGLLDVAVVLDDTTMPVLLGIPFQMVPASGFGPPGGAEAATLTFLTARTGQLTLAGVTHDCGVSASSRGTLTFTCAGMATLTFSHRGLLVDMGLVIVGGPSAIGQSHFVLTGPFAVVRSDRVPLTLRIAVDGRLILFASQAGAEVSTTVNIFRLPPVL